MPNRKTKLEDYSGWSGEWDNKLPLPAAISVETNSDGKKLLFMAPVEEIATTLELRKASRQFLLKYSDDVEKIRQHLMKSNPGDCKLLTFSYLWSSFYHVIVHPETFLAKGSGAQSDLCAFLTLWPDFTIKYLATLRAAFVKSRKRPTAMQKAIEVLRGKKDIIDAFKKTRRFDEATDLEICNFWKISTTDYKQAKRLLAEVDSAFLDYGKSIGIS